MTYSQQQIDAAIKTTRMKFYRSGGVAAIIAATGLHFLSQKADITFAAALFFGFIVGFGISGLLFPFGLSKQLALSKDPTKPKA